MIRTARTMAELKEGVLLWLEEIQPYDWYDLNDLTQQPRKLMLIRKIIQDSCTPEENRERGFDVTFSPQLDKIQVVPSDPDYKLPVPLKINRK